MENSQKVGYGLIGTVALFVAAMGGAQYLSPDQLDHSYVCSISQQVGIFDNLSSTAKTGYYSESGVVKSKVCTGGQWIQLRKYAADHNLSVNLLLQQAVNPSPSDGSRYVCDSASCKALN